MTNTRSDLDAASGAALAGLSPADTLDADAEAVARQERQAACAWQPLAALLQARGLMLATAESCTGGLIAAGCTSLAGSSAWFERGFVTYSNDAKSQLLGVPAALIEQHGAVSAEVAAAMAAGALAHSRAQVAVAVTGIAGPGGGSAAKPVGLVWFGFGLPGGAVRCESRRFEGDRALVRAQAVAFARAGLLQRVSALPVPAASPAEDPGQTPA